MNIQIFFSFLIVSLLVKNMFEMYPTKKYIALPAQMRPKNASWNMGFKVIYLCLPGESMLYSEYIELTVDPECLLILLKLSQVCIFISPPTPSAGRKSEVPGRKRVYWPELKSVVISFLFDQF